MPEKRLPPPRFLITNAIEDNREFIIHTHDPAFVAEIVEDETGARGLENFVWFSRQPAESEMDEIFTAARDAIREDDARLEPYLPECDEE